MLEELKPYYPYQAYCEFTTVGGEMILSKHPFTSKGGCLKGEGLVWREIEAKGKKFSLVSLHLHWPYPFEQYKQVGYFNEELKRIEGDIILAGDFNAVAWSHTAQRIAQSSRTIIPKGIRWSIKLQTPLYSIYLPIDHILASKTFDIQSIEVAQDLGSDHFPLLSTINFKKDF